jgi:hypothetical protein
MNIERLDSLTRAISTRLSRRTLASVLGLGALTIRNLTEAKKRKKKKHIKRNAFGCVNVGGFCKNADQCCSGICAGKKGKKKCRPHDGGSGCQAGQSEGCAGDPSNCVTSTGDTGVCDTTTGNAGYCGHGFVCTACSKDVDCQERCGQAAVACIKCPDCDGTATFQTACVGPGRVDCP